MKSLTTLLFRDLKKLTAQSLTLSLLVICGISLLVSSFSSYESLKAARDKYYQDYNFSDFFVDLKAAPETVLPQILRIPGVRAAEARIKSIAIISVPQQEEPAVGQFVQITRGDHAQNKLYLRHGTIPSELDTNDIVLHEAFAKAHDLKVGDHLTALLNGQQKLLRIVGIGISPEYVYALSPAAPLPDDKHFGVIWATRPLLEQVMGLNLSFNNLVLTIEPVANPEVIKNEVDQILEPYGTLGGYLRSKQISNMFVSDEINQQRISSIFFPLIFLSIAAFLVHIIISRLVTFQRSQIATLKALGYTSGAVMVHYLKLVLIMTSIGLLPGVWLGSYLGNIEIKNYENFFLFPSLKFKLNVVSIFLAFAATLLPAIVGALTSLRSVFHLSPAEAMRPPSPASFKQSLIDRLGLSFFFGIRVRMLWRNLWARPLRNVLIILGMALSLSIMVVSGGWLDIINYLMDTQFQKIQREDLSLSFIRPLHEDALQEIRGIKGVIEVEGLRATPIRLRHGHIEYETALIGWPEKSNLRRLMTANETVVEVSDLGLMLSRFYKTKLNIMPGDLVEVEVLEGERQKFELPVLGFSNEMIGNSASVNIAELWRLLDSEPTYNQAALRIDPHHATEIYVKLKQMPNIISVNLKSALYRGFKETMGAMITIFMLILVGFALAITVGIIYNSLRVTFAERSWEMASLMVFGFTKHEVFRLLFAEIAFQVVAAIIPGAFMGLGLTYLSQYMIHTETMQFPIIVEKATYAWSTLVIFLALALSSYVMWRSMKKINMVEALKARD